MMYYNHSTVLIFNLFHHEANFRDAVIPGLSRFCTMYEILQKLTKILEISNTKRFKGVNRLGGTIISQYHVLTVAHGFIRFDSSSPGPCK